MKQLLPQLPAGYSSIYIAVDGLDECDRGTRHILMDLLDELMAKFEQSIKIYIASRTDHDLGNHRGTHLEVTANDNQADIEKFVLNKMGQSEFCHNRLSQKLRNKILRTFQDKSQGIFQWATLHIGELLQLERNADIVECSDGFPRGLEAAYDKIYAQIANQVGSKRTLPLQLSRSSWYHADPCIPSSLPFPLLNMHPRNLSWIETLMLVQEYLETEHWSSIGAHTFMARICLRTLLCLTLPDEMEREEHVILERDDEEDWNDLVILRASQFEESKNVEIIPPEEEDQQTILDTCLPTTADTKVVREVSGREMKAAESGFDLPPFKCYLDWTEPHSHDDN
ncbi:ankyrin repeat-containing protein [Fusarium coicis]|nr:ankyrin repeat-containing protein [Fusarium coicis]